jgi:hypothetical protein
MIYTIYHIPGIKIGCTRNPNKRITLVQGFTEWEVLETHTDIYLASDREQELQRQYGLPVDTTPYWKTVQNSGLTIENARKGGRATGFTFEQRQKGGRTNKGIPKPYHVGLNLQKKVKCDACNKEMNAGNYTRWHKDGKCQY